MKGVWFRVRSPLLPSAVIALSIAVALGAFGRGVAASVVSEATAVAVLLTAFRGLRSVPPNARAAWTWVVAGMGLWVLGDIGWDITSFVTGDTPSLSLADIPYLAGYPVIAIGTRLLLRHRCPSKDREGLLDGLALAVSAMMATWQLLIVPSRDSEARLIAQLVAGAYPVGDVLLLASLAWLGFAPGHRSSALRWLLAFAGSTLFLDTVYLVASNADADGVVGFVNALYPCAYLFLARSVTSPDVGLVTEPGHVLVRKTNPVRLAVLGATLYTAPVLAYLRVRGAVDDLIFSLGGTTCLAILVVARFILVIREREAMEEAAAHRALHDELTGLVNRKLFLERVEFAQARQQQHGLPFAVLFLDLDRFKSVNDMWGHAIGNEVLISVGYVLQRCVRPGDVVARVGGDEFAVLCEDLAAPELAHEIAQRIVATLSDGLPKEAKLVSASVGVAVSDPGGARNVDAGSFDAEAMLHRADLAMYRVKGDGGRAWRRFDDELDEWSSRRRTIEAQLADALEREEFRLAYQPIVRLDRSECVGFEALLRWNRPGLAPVSPADFIPVAEATGLIIPIGEWVLDEACLFAAQASGRYVTVNVSPLQLKRSNVAKSFASSLERSGIFGDRVVIEITESAWLSDMDRIDLTMENLVALGARIAVDDFGTGYSSLAYLDRFPVSIVKIDRTLLDRIDVEESQRAVVRAITTMASSLGFTVVAEGVERESQRLALLELDVVFAQGWLFAPAMAREEALAFADGFGSAAVPSPQGPSTPGAMETDQRMGTPNRSLA